jgi:hypothetical protein
LLEGRDLDALGAYSGVGAGGSWTVVRRIKNCPRKGRKNSEKRQVPTTIEWIVLLRVRVFPFVLWTNCILTRDGPLQERGRSLAVHHVQVN